MAEIGPGKLAPDFTLPTAEGSITLSDFRGRIVVLYFYPADDTETCTIEAVDFSARRAEFEAAGATIVGVSPDSPKSHEKFCRKHGLGILLASDTDRETIRRYGLWTEKTMFGRTFMGVERATFLLGRDGRIVRAWRKVRLKGHVADVLASVREIGT